jgi:hypothetical protein
MTPAVNAGNVTTFVTRPPALALALPDPASPQSPSALGSLLPTRKVPFGFSPVPFIVV